MDKELFDNVERKKKILLEELCVFGIIEEGRALDVDENIKYLFFKTLYLWTTVFISPLRLSYHDFFLFFLLLLVKWLFLYALCVPGGALRLQ